MEKSESYLKKAQEKYNQLQFRDDFLFCKILENNEDITKEIIELILGIKVRKVEIQKQEAIEITSDGRGIRLDVYAEDENNTVFDIEMQTTKQKKLPKRTRYYQGMIDLNQIERGVDFAELKRTFIIFICMSDPFCLGRHYYSFENICLEHKELRLGDETEKIFLNAAGTEDDVSDEVLDFCNLLKNGTGKTSLSKKIEAQVDKASAHIEWRREYMTLYMRDLQNREEGREEGRTLEIISSVREGDYSPERGAEKLGITLDEFLAMMRDDKRAQ